MGTSSDLMLAEQVFAVGNAFGYEHTVTSGIVSALSRDVEVDETQSYRNLIQTDASINPGNSGGPLLNLNGEVIGINVAIRAGAQRIGFAIPIDDARETIARLLSTERLDGVAHGVIASDVKTPDECKLVVQQVDSGSPADQCGLKAGDIIRKAREVQVNDSADWERALLELPVGKVIDIIVGRDGRDVTMQFSVGVGRSGQSQMTASKNNSPTRIDAAQTVSVSSRPVNKLELPQKQEEQTPSPSTDPVFERVWQLFGVRLSELPERDRRQLGNRYNGGHESGLRQIRQPGRSTRHPQRRCSAGAGRLRNSGGQKPASHPAGIPSATGRHALVPDPSNWIGSLDWQHGSAYHPLSA